MLNPNGPLGRRILAHQSQVYVETRRRVVSRCWFCGLPKHS